MTRMVHCAYLDKEAEGLDRSPWPGELGKKVMKKKGEFKLTVFDLLKENQQIKRTVTGSYIEDSNSQIFTQYFMLSFTFNIRSFGLDQELPIDKRDQLRQRLRQRFGGNEN